MNCPTCNNEFTPKRKDSKYCSSICYRRDPEIAKKYSRRTADYQNKIARKPDRKYQKLVYKCSHEKRELDISKEQCFELWAKGCNYCGASVAGETGVGLDRLDNARGYTLDNVVTCCGACNQIKNTHLTHEEMKAAMIAVLKVRNNE